MNFFVVSSRLAHSQMSAGASLSAELERGSQMERYLPHLHQINPMNSISSLADRPSLAASGNFGQPGKARPKHCTGKTLHQDAGLLQQQQKSSC